MADPWSLPVLRRLIDPVRYAADRRLAFGIAAILLVEPQYVYRRIIHWFLGLGIGVTAHFLYSLVRFPVGVHVFGDSLVYDSTHTHLEPVLVVYLLVTCACGLASSHQAIRAFGVLAFILAAVAYLVKAQAFVSVWCLFAAILSLVLYAYFAGPDRGEWSTMADEIEHADPHRASSNPVNDTAPTSLARPRLSVCTLRTFGPAPGFVRPIR